MSQTLNLLLNPFKSKTIQALEKYKQFQSLYLRTSWPALSPSLRDKQRANIAVICVNYNTADLIAMLVFSLCRIVGRDQFKEIVIVDNHSTDGSKPMLEVMSEAGLIHAIFNDRQQYHGPGLNQAMHYLAEQQTWVNRAEDVIDYVLILDSDVVVLRDDILDHAVTAVRQSGAALCGQYQPSSCLQGGYAHVSSLLIDPFKIWRRGVAPFEDHGEPGVFMQQSMVQRGVPRLNFPLRSQGYLIHLGRGTLNAIRDEQITTNKFYKWASKNARVHYHGEKHGPYLYEEFLEVFADQVPDFLPQTIIEACLRPERLVLKRPPEVAKLQSGKADISV